MAHRPDTTIEVFNDRACSLLRMSPAQMTGRSALDHAWYFVDVQGQRLPPSAYPVSRLLQSRQPLPPTVLGIVSEAFRPMIGPAYLLYGLLLPVWFALVGRTLWRLGRRERT